MTKKATNNKLKENNDNGKINLSAPWMFDFGRGNAMSGEYMMSEEVIMNFIEDRTRLHEIYICEQEKTKRLALILSSILFICALFIVVFAPEGREELSYWIGGTLLLFSASAAGYKRLWAKGPLLSIESNESNEKK